MKSFWKELQKRISSSSPASIRYHPIIITFCLNLAAKSSSAYKDLRYDNTKGTGVIALPSLRTLCYYKNCVRSKRGFNLEVIDELAKKLFHF